MRAWLSVVVLAVSALGSSADAQVYKCQIQGKTVYADTPCVQGTQSEVSVAPALAPDADAQQAAQGRAAYDVKRADEIVAEARKRTDADAKRRAEIAVAERKAEEARLKKEAAEAKAAEQDRKAYKPKLVKPQKPGGFTARSRDDGSGASLKTR